MSHVCPCRKALLPCLHAPCHRGCENEVGKKKTTLQFQESSVSNVLKSSSFLTPFIENQETKGRRKNPGLLNLRVIISFSQLSANIFVVWTFLLRTITKLEHFLCRGHTRLLAQLSVSVSRARDSANLLCLVLMVFLA